MSARSTGVEFRSLDGLRLRGTMAVAPGKTADPALLVHGGGVTRDEGGFFTRLSSTLAESGVSALRFDFRGHGESEGRQEDLTISGILNDIRAAREYLCGLTGAEKVNLIGASFGGGISAFYAARNPEQVRRLVLFNPLLNYKKRFIDDKPYWEDDHISEDAGSRLSRDGFIEHSPTFKLGRALLNEVFYLQPHTALPGLVSPTLIVHGTGDTFVPVDSSRNAMHQITAPARIVEIEGAQHGFAVCDDPAYEDPQTLEWQAEVISTVSEWIAGRS